MMWDAVSDRTRPSIQESAPHGSSTTTHECDALDGPGVGIDVYDFFSGCGGTSAGLKRAGLRPVIAVDFDEGALATYSKNFPEAKAILEDIRRLGTSQIQDHFAKVRQNAVLMCACAPCQPFSKQNRHKDPEDARASLLGHLGRFVTRFRPELLLIENVPGIRANAEANPLAELISLLDELGYEHDAQTVMAHDYGVPQARRRLLLVASLLGPITLPQATHGTAERPHLTVKDAIYSLPPLAAGGEDNVVLNHQAANLSELNLRRIRASRQGGNWNDWPADLRLPCHTEVDGYTDVYGRMDWSRPAPALTTRCISYSNGRFGHPDQDRAISVREAALLQTFDDDFEFVGNLASMAKQIGNAVPVRLAEALGHMFRAHVRTYLKGSHGEG
jgi:DNA (cytosine-5)-methyltransferase 1